MIGNDSIGPLVAYGLLVWIAIAAIWLAVRR